MHLHARIQHMEHNRRQILKPISQKKKKKDKEASIRSKTAKNGFFAYKTKSYPKKLGNNMTKYTIKKIN